MTEALGGLIKFIFENTNINKIELRHNVKNIASGKVMQKNNLKLDGILRQEDTKDLSDHKLYSILREEYFNKKS